MQPYFFPYLGYFDLVASSDVFVFYDDASFSKNSWYNRNRILSKNKEWEYVRVSIQGSSLGTFVKEIRLNNKPGDLNRTNNLLQTYRRAPYYRDVIALVNETFESSDELLASITIESIKRSAAYIGLKCFFVRSSELEYMRDQDAVGKVISVCKTVGATQYVNLPGGRELYNADVFFRHGVELSFTPNLDLTYPVSGFNFVPNLSIIDVLMWCAPQSIRSYLASRRA